MQQKEAPLIPNYERMNVRRDVTTGTSVDSEGVRVHAFIDSGADGYNLGRRYKGKKISSTINRSTAPFGFKATQAQKGRSAEESMVGHRGCRIAADAPSSLSIRREALKTKVGLGWKTYHQMPLVAIYTYLNITFQSAYHENQNVHRKP